MTSVDLGQVTMSVQIMEVTSQHLSRCNVHITGRNAEVRKLQALKRYGTQVLLNMTLKIRSQVKCHSRYGLEISRDM